MTWFTGVRPLRADLVDGACSPCCRSARGRSPRPTSATGWRGAPERPRMLRKVLATTLVAAVIWLGCYA